MRVHMVHRHRALSRAVDNDVPVHVQPDADMVHYQPPQQVEHPTLLIIRFDNAVELEQHLHDTGHVYSVFHGRFVRK